MTKHKFPNCLLAIILLCATCFHQTGWSEENEPVEEGFVAMADGPRLYFRKMGNGPNKIVIPAALFLEDALKPLADSKRTLIFYDMRNRGRSDYVQNEQSLTIQQDIEDLEQLRRHFQLDRISLIGISYLGSMVVLYTAQHPESVERIIQIGAIPLKYGTEYDPAFKVRDAKPVIDPEKQKELQSLREQGYDRKFPRADCKREWTVFRDYFVGNPANSSKLGTGPCDLPNEWPLYFRRHLEHHFGSVQKLAVSRDSIRKVQQPTLTVHGTKDRNAPYGGGREWAFLLPNARLMTIEGAAHFPWVEAPEILIAALNQFLNGTWPAKSEKVTSDPALPPARSE